MTFARIHQSGNHTRNGPAKLIKAFAISSAHASGTHLGRDKRRSPYRRLGQAPLTAASVEHLALRPGCSTGIRRGEWNRPRPHLVAASWTGSM